MLAAIDALVLISMLAGGAVVMAIFGEGLLHADAMTRDGDGKYDQEGFTIHREPPLASGQDYGWAVALP